MIPILFDKSETAFNTNGLGRLSDCISCIVTEERNGVYECEFEYPITGAHYEDIEEGRVIYVTHDESGDPQPFDIYSHTKPINGIVTFYAHHISYRLGEITVKPFSASSISGAMAAIPGKSVNTNPFTFWTNKSSSGTYKVDVPTSCRALLCGEEGSLLDVYGTGEYQFDKFNVKLYLHRGTNSGVEIRYGKNLVDLTDEVDYQNTYTAVVPYWFGTTNDGDTEEDVLVTLPEWAISSGHSSYTGRVVLVPMDLSSEWQDPPVANTLRTRAQALLGASNAWLPSQNINVNFVALWQTEEYAEYAPLQRVHLCDTVSVYYPELGVNAVQKKVVKVVYNTLLDRYDSIELGELSNTLVGMINSNVQENIDALRAAMNNRDATIQQVIEAAVQNATDLITGGLGGHVVLKQNADGQPEEILIMNTDDINTATKVWRWNLGGLGYSSTGYEGTYGTAITMNGEIVADYITAGTLNANIMKAGIISDVNNQNFWNLETGEFSLQPSAYTLYQSTNPANAWTTDAEKQAHVGYLWFYDGANNLSFDTGLCDENGSQLQNENSVDIEGTYTVFPERVYRYAETFGWVIYDGIDSAVDSAVNTAIEGYDDTLTQQKIFDRLTRNGLVKGIYMENGQLYINANYIATGILADPNENTVFNLATGEFTMKKGSINLGSGNFIVTDAGVITMKKGSINLGSGAFSVTDAGVLTMSKGSISLGNGVFSVDNNGALTCSNATITGGSLTIGSNFSVTSAGVITAKSGKIGPWSVTTSKAQINVDDDYLDITADGLDFYQRYEVSPGTYVKDTYTMFSPTQISFFDSLFYFYKNSGTFMIETNKDLDSNVSVYATGTALSVKSCNNSGGSITIGSNGISAKLIQETTSYYGNLYSSGSGYIYKAKQGTSSITVKRDVAPVKNKDLLPENLYDVDVIQFKYKDSFLTEGDKNKDKDLIGFIVEDLDKKYPVATYKEDEKDPSTWGWSPIMMIPPMLKLIQDQHKDIEELKRRLK